MQRKESSRSGMGFFSWLTILFVVAKILGFITWPWLVVYSPFIFIIALSIVVVVLDGLLESHDS